MSGRINVGQHVQMRDVERLGADRGRVEQAASDRGRQIVGVRWDSGLLGWVEPDDLEPDPEHGAATTDADVDGALREVRRGDL